MMGGGINRKITAQAKHKTAANDMDIPSEIAIQAVELLLEWQSAEDPEAVWQKIEYWRSSPVNERAWQRIEAINAKFSTLSASGQSLPAHTSLTTPALTRRQTLKALSFFIFAGSTGWLTYQQQWHSDYRTGYGQQQQITLPDGTEITLNSYSAFDVRYNTSERRIILHRGEIYIKTGPPNTRAFIVQTSNGELEPLGTRFAVRKIQGFCHLAVYEGKVRLKPASIQKSTIVDAGFSLRFSQRKWTETSPVAEVEAAWIRGIIVVVAMPLGEFLTELNRHRVGIIQSDPSVANLKVSGTFPLNQADDALHALHQALPIQVQNFTRYWIRVLPA